MGFTNSSGGTNIIVCPSGGSTFEDTDTFAVCSVAAEAGTDKAGNEYAAGDTIVTYADGSILAYSEDTDTFAGQAPATETGTDSNGVAYDVGDTVITFADGSTLVLADTDTFAMCGDAPADGTDKNGTAYAAGDTIITFANGDVLVAANGSHDYYQAATAGTDATGAPYAAGDWIGVDADGDIICVGDKLVTTDILNGGEFTGSTVTTGTGENVASIEDNANGTARVSIGNAECDLSYMVYDQYCEGGNTVREAFNTKTGELTVWRSVSARRLGKVKYPASSFGPIDENTPLGVLAGSNVEITVEFPTCYSGAYEHAGGGGFLTTGGTGGNGDVNLTPSYLYNGTTSGAGGGSGGSDGITVQEGAVYEVHIHDVGGTGGTNNTGGTQTFGIQYELETNNLNPGEEIFQNALTHFTYWNEDTHCEVTV